MRALIASACAAALLVSSAALALPAATFQGKPAFTAGASLGAYVWHDADGHHVRFTTLDNKIWRTFKGKVCGKNVTELKPVRTEVGDGIKVGPQGHCVFFDFKTNAGLDGFDFRMPEGDKIAYDFHLDGKQMRPALIHVGAGGTHPARSPFVLDR